jgi:hypothetical protein
MPVPVPGIELIRMFEFLVSSPRLVLRLQHRRRRRQLLQPFEPQPSPENQASPTLTS